MDRLYNLLTSYPPLIPSLLIHLSPPSSSSMHLIKVNRERMVNLDQIVGILDSKIPMETTRRNMLVVFRTERPNSSGKARKIKHLPLLSPITIHSPDSHLLLNSQIVCISWTLLQIFWRTPRSLYTLLQHLPSDLLLLWISFSSHLCLMDLPFLLLLMDITSYIPHVTHYDLSYLWLTMT